MAVTSDLPRSRSRAGRNSVLHDRNGEPLGLLTGNQKRIFLKSEEIAPVHEAGDHRDRGPPLLHERGHRPARHRRARSTRTSARRRRSRAARRSRCSSSRTRSPRRTSARCSRRCARPRSPTRSRASGPRSGSCATTSTRSTSATAPTASRPPRAPTSAPPTPAAARTASRRCAQVLEPGEAALLAGMVASPSGYDPLANREAAGERRALVLQRMVEQGYITPAQQRGGARDVAADQQGHPPAGRGHARTRTSRRGSSSRSSTSSAAARRARARRSRAA